MLFQLLTVYCIATIPSFTHAQWPQQHGPFRKSYYSSFIPSSIEQGVFQLRQVMKKPQHLIQPHLQVESLPSPFSPITKSQFPDENGEFDVDPDADLKQQEYQDRNIQQQNLDQVLQQQQQSLKPNSPFVPVFMKMVPSAACGRGIFKPGREFCYKNRPYNLKKFGKCGARVFNRNKYFCFNGQTHYKLRKGICGNGIYDKLTQICLNHEIKNICAGEIFDSRTHFCYERIYNRMSYAMCGKRVYKKSTHICMRGKVYSRRRMLPSMGVFFNPKELTMLEKSSRQRSIHDKNVQNKWIENSLLTRPVEPNQVSVTGQRKDTVPVNAANLQICGTGKYDMGTHFCYEGKITKRCGLMAYNPSTLLCFRNFLYTKGLYDMCGNEMLNKFTQSCINGHIYKHDQKKLPQIQKLFLDYGTDSERDKKEKQDILKLSKQLAAEKRDYKLRHENTSCQYGLTFNKRSHFCYNGKMYNRTINGMCGSKIYNRRTHRCLAGGQIFPILDLSKSSFYAPQGDVNMLQRYAANIGR